MAAYLSLKHKESGEVYTGRKLIAVDAMLCEALDVPITDEWHNNWMDWIGFMLAYRADKSVVDVLTPSRADARDNEQKIIDFFINNFENESYHQHGR